MSNNKPIENWVEPPASRYINRELSWIAFNQRVLEEARNPSNPLLERLNFLSISGSNLDEFTMVRIAGLMDQVAFGVDSVSIDGLNAAQQLESLREATGSLINDQQACWTELHQSLQAEGIAVVDGNDLSEGEHAWLHDYFMESLFPVLTPIALDPAHPFPFIPNLGLVQIFKIYSESEKRTLTAVILFPPRIKRFVLLPNAKDGFSFRYILVEEIIRLFLDVLFPGFEEKERGLFRVVRDSDLDLEDEAKDLIVGFEQALKRRRHGRIVRIKATNNTAEELLSLVAQDQKVAPENIIRVEGMPGLAQLREIYEETQRPDLKYPAFNVRFPERIEDFDGDCFAAIAAKDIVVHHPYESFDVVVQFIRQAARDPDVISIKGTLYRTSEDSPIIAAMIEAAEQGKSVTAVVELKARFDEAANIRWARDLERAGVQVVYGFVKLKTHAKVTLVTRKTQEGLKSYVHYGTGNYHPSTARIYTDLSFFTCDERLCLDAAHFFNFVTGYAQPRDVDKLVMAPRNLRDFMMEKIQQEIDFAKEGKPAHIWWKMNALLDPQIIDALYEASQAGVKIMLIVRGVCSLRPGVAGLSENITVKSIIGRFLEHARIYAFGNGGELPSDKALLFIGSADMMPRNLDARVEVLVPIENPTVHAQILGQVMVANIKDDLQSWRLLPNGSYQRMVPQADGFSAHSYFMHNPSLSGRGRALKQMDPPGADIYQLHTKNSPINHEEG
jgi:polyphosphate kinase